MRLCFVLFLTFGGKRQVSEKTTFMFYETTSDSIAGGHIVSPHCLRSQWPSYSLVKMN